MVNVATWLEMLSNVEGVNAEADVLLAPYTSMRVGGPADLVARAESPEAVAAVVRVCRAQDVPLTVLGGGTNLLISDRGVRGLVLELGRHFNVIEELGATSDNGALWRVGAGTPTGKLVRHALAREVAGPEVLAGIPGTVGGALIMNAGGHEGEIGDIVERVHVLLDGEERWLMHDEAGFGYRSSLLGGETIVLGCELRVAAGRIDELQNKVHRAQARRKETQPLSLPNAGSIFKNPTGDYAGRLIEASGCKGWREGSAQVSDVHANFIVNQGGATAGDIFRLIRRIQTQVLNDHAIELELEVRLLGDFDTGLEHDR